MSTATISADPPIGRPGPVPSRVYTPDDLLTMKDGDRYELVDGRLVEKHMGALSQFVGTRLARLLGNHCDPIGSAYVWTEQGYACFPDKPKQVRKPDVSVILAARMTPAHFREGFTSIRPDLAAEVNSPNDLAEDLEEKLDDYRAAGIPLIWVVSPTSRRVRVIRADGSTSDLGPDTELDGEDVLPGFRCRVSDLFAGLPEGPAETPA